MTHSERLPLIEKTNNHISIARQANLLDVSRSSVYYAPKVNEEDIAAMNRIDEIYTERPFYGSRRIKEELKEYRISIGREHVQKLMRVMGLEAIYPKKRTSFPDISHKTYPYLLSGISPFHPNHIWGTDITYVRLEKGFAYLVALLDWFSRFVLSWELSPSLSASFCVDALQRALRIAIPDVHNSDQGSQFTSCEYTVALENAGIKISMDGKGRCMDNIFTERLWRTVKYENIYLKSYHNITEARQGLHEYFTFYNKKRKHQSLNYHTPQEIYFQRSNNIKN